MTMKTSLSASVYRLLHGEQRINFCCTNGISRSLYSVLYNGRYRRVFSYQCQGLQRSRTFSSINEDDFEELGPPSEGLATQFKLLTQKPELHVRNGPTKKLNRSRPSSLSISPDFNKPSKTSRSILQDCDNLYGKYGDMRNHSKVDSCSVTAEVVTNRLDDRNTDFKAEVVTNRVDDRNTDFKIVTIRIQDIAKATTYHIIHSICKSFGVLEGLAKTEDYIDVLFRVNNDTDSQKIVKRLNSTVIDESKWSAYELLENSSGASSSSTSEDDRYKTAGLEINVTLFEMKQQMAYKKMCCEDLELLHLSVMHLQGLPTVFNPFNSINA